MYKTFANYISLFSTNKTRRDLVNVIKDQYKTSKKSHIINFLSNQFYCFGGYWIEELRPGTFQSIFFEKTKERIDQYKDIKKEADQFINEIDLEYKYLKKEIKDLF